MEWLNSSEQSRAQRLGCTVEQLRAHHAKNADVLRGMLSKAESTGKKVNGWTAAKIRKFLSDAETLARGEWPQS